MALVKLLNVGDAPFIASFNGQYYMIENNEEDYIVVQEEVAKHWLGDWDLEDNDDKLKEQRRVDKLFGTNRKFKIKVVPVMEVKETKRKEQTILPNQKKITINENLIRPDEEEFEALGDLVDKKKKSTKKK